MSLLVGVQTYDERGQSTEIKVERGKDLAGFESFRYKLYGSALAESLGFKLLPQLKQSDLYVETQRLDELKDELEIILEKVKEFSQVSEFEEQYIKERVQNILDAIEIAKRENGILTVS